MAKKGVVIHGWMIFLFAVILIGAWYTNYMGYWSLNTAIPKPAAATVVNQWTANQYTYTLWSNGTTTSVYVGGGGTIPNTEPEPILFTLIDPLLGGGITNATLKVYDASNVQQESLTTSSGAAETINPYAPGTSLYVVQSAPGYVNRTTSFTVPSTLSHDFFNAPVYNVKIQTIKLGSWTIKCVDSSGLLYSTTNSYNFTANVTTSMTFTFTIYEATDNYGYWSSYDPLDNINQNMIFYGTTTTSYVVVQGGTPYTRGSTTNYVTILPDGYPYAAGSNPSGLTRVKVGNTYAAQGVTSVSYTFGIGSLPAGTTQIFMFYMYDASDVGYFATNGIGGPNAASCATVFTLDLKA